MDQTVTLIFFFAGIFIIGGLLFTFISLVKRSPKSLDIEKYQSRWKTIEAELNRDDHKGYIVCIMNADSLLDKALQERGISGKTMAERMKEYQGKWTNGNGLWAAHKLRNRVVHEPETVQLDYERARQALIAFKQALKDVGAI